MAKRGDAPERLSRMMSHISDRAAQADSSPSASGRGLARTLKVGLGTCITSLMAWLHTA